MLPRIDRAYVQLVCFTVFVLLTIGVCPRGEPPVFAQPTTPATTFTLVGAFPARIGTEALAVGGGLALIADREAGLRILDIRDPTQPRLLSTFTPPVLFFPSVVKMAGQIAAVADPASGVYLLDLSDPARPRQLSVYPITQGEDAILSMDLSQNRLYIGTYRDGVRVFDVSRPAELRLLGTYPGVEARFFANKIIVAEDRMYLTGMTRESESWTFAKSG